MAEPFIAEIRIFGFNFAPRGWAYCDGALLPVAQNTALFSIIGTTYGGDGRTTTQLPNLQDRAAMHPGRGPGLTDRRLGEKVGVDTVTLTSAQMPDHTHSVNCQNATATAQTPTNNYLATEAGPPTPFLDAQPNADMSGSAIGSVGGGQAHTNLQPLLALNFCIALLGTYPSRS